MLALQTPAAARTAEQNAAVFAAWRTSVAEAKPINDEIDALWNTFPQAATSILHLAEQEPANRRKTHLLDRGNWDQPLQRRRAAHAGRVSSVSGGRCRAIGWGLPAG